MTQTSLAAVAGAAAGSSPAPTSPQASVADTVSRADHDTGIAHADADGRKAGAEGERKRLMDVLSADGIAGNASRMNHALELAAEAPEMSADKIVSMTVKHIPESGAASTGANLADRVGDADPIGAAAVNGHEPVKSGIDACAIYAVHNGTA